MHFVDGKQHRTTHTLSFSETITLSAFGEIEVQLEKWSIQQAANNTNRDMSDQENDHRPTHATATDILLVVCTLFESRYIFFLINDL